MPLESDGLAIFYIFRSSHLMSWPSANLLYFCNKDSIWDFDVIKQVWLHFDIYIDVLCVPAWSWDGTDTQRLDRIGSGRYKGVAALRGAPHLGLPPSGAPPPQTLGRHQVACPPRLRGAPHYWAPRAHAAAPTLGLAMGQAHGTPRTILGGFGKSRTLPISSGGLSTVSRTFPVHRNFSGFPPKHFRFSRNTSGSLSKWFLLSPKTFLVTFSNTPNSVTTQQIKFILSVWPCRFWWNIDMNKTSFCSMINSGTMDIHVDPYTHTNDIRVNLWLSYAIPFASRYFTKPEVRYIDILLSHSHAHYTGLLVTGFVLLSRYHVPASLWLSHLCLARWWWMPSHREGPKNISPSSEEQIPLLSYLAPCHTFR